MTKISRMLELFSGSKLPNNNTHVLGWYIVTDSVCQVLDTSSTAGHSGHSSSDTCQHQSSTHFINYRLQEDGDQLISAGDVTDPWSCCRSDRNASQVALVPVMPP